MAGLSGILLFHFIEWSDQGPWKVLSRRSFSSSQISAPTPFASLLCPQTGTQTHSIAHCFTQFQWEIHTEWNEAACWRALTSCLPLKKPVRNHEFTEEIKVRVIDSLPAEVAFFLDCPPLSLFFINVRIDFILSRIKEKIKIPPSCSPWGTTLSTLIFETLFYADSNTCLYLLHFSCNGKGLNYIYCSALVFFLT